MFGDQAILASNSPVFVLSSVCVRSVRQGGQGNPLFHNESKAVVLGTPVWGAPMTTTANVRADLYWAIVFCAVVAVESMGRTETS